MMETDNNLWTDAKCAALKVEFLNTKEELSLYATAIYSAMVWCGEVDGENKAIRERDKSVK